MYCKKCGEEILGDVKYCPFCGAPVAEEKKQQKNTSNNENYNVASIVGIIFGGTFFILPFLYLFPLVATVSSIIGLIQTSGSNNSQKGKGMAIGGLILGIIGLVVSIGLTILMYRFFNKVIYTW